MHAPTDAARTPTPAQRWGAGRSPRHAMTTAEVSLSSVSLHIYMGSMGTDAGPCYLSIVDRCVVVVAR